MASFSKCILILVACLIGASWALELEEVVATCATDCLADALSSTTCPETDMNCLCHDIFYLETSFTCVDTNCTSAEAVAARNATDTACGHPARHFDSTVNSVRAATLVLKMAALLARLVLKMSSIGPGWGWDDHTTMAAFAVSIGMTATSFLEQQHGEGRDAWALADSNVRNFLRVFLIFELLHVVAVGLIKASLLFFILRRLREACGGGRPSTGARIAVQITQLVNISFVVAFGAGTILQCQPLDYFWTGWRSMSGDGSNTSGSDAPGKCFDLDVFGYAHAGLNLALNVWLMVFPLTLLVRTRKLSSGGYSPGAMVMFGFGILLTSIGALRLHSLWTSRGTTNPTHDLLAVLLWSSVEVDLGIVLLCLPSLALIPSTLGWRRPFSSTPKAKPRSYQDGNLPSEKNNPKGSAFPTYDGNGGWYDEGAADAKRKIDWKYQPEGMDSPSSNPPHDVSAALWRTQHPVDLNRDLPPSPPIPPSPSLMRPPSSPWGRRGTALLPASLRSSLSSRRETMRSTQGKNGTTNTKSWRSTATSRIGEIQIMIDRAILVSDGGSNNSTPRRSPHPLHQSSTTSTTTITTNGSSSSASTTTTSSPGSEQSLRPGTGGWI